MRQPASAGKSASLDQGAGPRLQGLDTLLDTVNCQLCQIVSSAPLGISPIILILLRINHQALAKQFSLQLLSPLNIQFAGFGFVAGVGLGAGTCYLYVSKRQPLHTAGGPGVQLAPHHQHPALKYGMPTTSMVRECEGYVASFDYRTRNPAWVIEYLTEENMVGDGDRSKSEFYEDKSIEERFRSKLADYRGSGYDRGHMAPAGDHKHSQKEMDSTFCLTNMSPQVGKGYNRDYWARNAPELVSVPTHYYKVMLVDGIKSKDGMNKGAGSVGVGAFVMPNAPIDPSTPMTAFTVPLEALEATAGTKFFPGLLDDKKRKVVDMASHVWRDHGLQKVKMFDRLALLKDMASLPAPPESTTGTASAGAKTTAVTTTSSGKKTTVPVTAPGHGAIHVCEVNACELPPVDFWKTGKGPDQGKKKKKDEYKGPKFGRRSILNLFKIFL
eukprot:gene18519-25022_t